MVQLLCNYLLLIKLDMASLVFSIPFLVFSCHFSLLILFFLPVKCLFMGASALSIQIHKRCVCVCVCPVLILPLCDEDVLFNIFSYFFAFLLIASRHSVVSHLQVHPFI